MKMNKNLLYSSIALVLLTCNGCDESFLDVQPKDRITSVTFWQSESDVKLALNGIYSVLRHRGVYGSGPTLDAITPYAYQWAHWNGKELQIGNGSNTPASDGLTMERWTMCYQMINRANYFLANIDKVTLTEAAKAAYVGEVHFLRGIAYALLAETYGGVPIVTSVIDTEGGKKGQPRHSFTDMGSGDCGL